MAMNTAICPYSLYSLQFFLVFPLAKIWQFLGLPTILALILALAAPALTFSYLVKALDKRHYITLAEHEPGKTNHKHTRAITINVILHSSLLGIMFTVGMSLVRNHELVQHFPPLGLYLMMLSTFHFSEYFVTSLTNPSTLSISSFLVNQSSAYVIAIASSFIEYILEAYFFPGFKEFNAISIFGFLLALSGDIIRKLAMFTAKTNFSHTIRETKSPEHSLVTHGVYSYFRHPSYAGWFYWAVGSQMMLLNPICAIMFAVISYRFFKDRIAYEEELLVDFFGQQYMSYRHRVGLWMPISIRPSGQMIRVKISFIQ